MLPLTLTTCVNFTSFPIKGDQAEKQAYLFKYFVIHKQVATL